MDADHLIIGTARYDLSESEPIRYELGVTYQNECVQVNMNVSRRYTSSSTIEPSTEFGFTVALTGYSVTSGGQQYKRRCS